MNYGFQILENIMVRLIIKQTMIKKYSLYIFMNYFQPLTEHFLQLKL